ncbi:MAG: glycerophosphoryl diester phosphodiesterase [Alphaproteobacteria bacterium]|jgi:glycerophosphoryl diester phosphodiesterase
MENGMLSQILNSYRHALRLIGPFLAIHVFFRLISSAILVPVIVLLAGIAISFSDQSALTDQDIARFLATPAGAIGGLAIVSLLIVSAILDVALMTGVLRSGVRRPIAALRTAAAFSLRAALPMARFALGLLVRVLVVAIPFALFAAAVAFLLLREFDINYYLTNRPPAFLAAAALIGLAVAVLALVLIRRLSDWAVALHLVLFDGKSVATAFAESSAQMRGHRARIVGQLAIWLALRFALGTVVAFVAALALAAGPDLFGANLRLITTALFLTVLVWGALDLLIGAMANGALADILNKAFDRALADHAARTDIQPATGGGLLSPVTIGLTLAVILSIGSLAGGGALLDRIRPDSDIDVIGHRGAAGSTPENTMASVLKAIGDGADWVEIDVQETADGQVVVVHDSDFMKAAGVDLKVWDATIEDIARIDIGSVFDAAYSDQRAPLLSDVLAAAKGRAKVIIELKYYGHDVDLENRVIALVEEAGMEGQIATMSLKYPAVQKMLELRPDWRAGVLAATSIGDLSGLQGDFLAVNLGEVSHRLLSSAEAAGKDVYAWTVNDPLTMSRMISMGVDGLITDEPALAQQVIAYRAGLDTPGRVMLWVSDRFGLAFDIDDATKVEQ